MVHIEFQIKDLKTNHIYKENMSLYDFVAFVHNNNKFIYQIMEVKK